MLPELITKNAARKVMSAEPGIPRVVRVLASLLPDLSAVSPTSASAVAVSLLGFSKLSDSRNSTPAGLELMSASPVGADHPKQVKPVMPSNTRRIVRVVTLILAALFLVSCALNLGAKIPLGFAQLSFSTPSMSIAEFEIVIGLVLLAAAAISRLYPYAGAYLLASVGIAEGLLSPSVQGFARNLHESMIPFAIAGWILLAVETRSAYKSRDTSAGQTNRTLVTALQFFNGALVILGGLGFAASATYPVGTALGVVHLLVGLVDLFAGYAFLKREPYSRRLLIAINAVTIAYSAFSESLAEVYALMTPGIGDALIGTIIAIVVSIAIIYLLESNKSLGQSDGAPS
jgi:hypothetical protein